MRGTRFIESLIQDLRYGLRQLRRSPGFTAVAVLTLALGVGANTAVFSLINAVLLRPLPYPHPDRLMHVDWKFEDGNVPSVSGEEYIFWREHSQVFASTGAQALFPTGLNLSSGVRAEYVKGWKVSHDFFRTLGVQPFLGRAFTAEEDRPNGPHSIILSFGLWRRRFGADPGLIGRSISLNGESYTVVGVMPKQFEFMLPYATINNVEVWLPLRLVPKPQENGHDYAMVARLKPGVTIAQAQAEMARVLNEIRQDLPGYVRSSERGAFLIPYQRWTTGDVRAPLLILWVAVGLVLLIATVNLANLLIARSATRHGEIAVRRALGATSARMARQLVTESLLVALSGGIVALIVAPWAARVLLATSHQSLPISGPARADFHVLLFTLVITAMAGVLAGLAPLLSMPRLNLSQSLKEGSHTSSLGSERQRVRRWLVGAELALSTLLVTGALLLSFSLIALEQLKPGFNSHDLWSFHISLTPTRLKSASATWNFEREEMASLKKLPGVQSAGATSSLPLEFSLNFGTQVITGGRESHVYVEAHSVTPGYFSTMEIPILHGRGFSESDTAASMPSAIVNQAFVRQCCAGRDPLGSRIFPGFGPRGNAGWQIVGVAGDTKEGTLSEPYPPAVFLPQAQLDNQLSRAIYMGSLSSWVIRTSVPPDLSEVQRAIGQIDPSEAVADLQPMSNAVAGSLSASRFEAVLMSNFAGMALALAAIGLYGVISYGVAERTHEIGIRMALGAKRRSILGLVLGEGALLVASGVTVGIAGAFIVARFLASVLYGVRPTDPTTFLGAALVLVVVALLACYIPARRAAKVNPTVALRHE